MHVVKQFLLVLLNYKIFIYFVISTELLARLGMGATFVFKKTKNRLKKEEAQRSRMFKLFGLYHFSQTYAPHHMKKYAGIRICNIISFILTTSVYFLISYEIQLKSLFQAMVAMHAVFLIGPIIFDSVMLSNTKKCGKCPDFEMSRKP